MSRPNRGTRLADKPNVNGAWEIVWTENGRSRRVSTGTGSRREAEAVLAGFILEREKQDTRGGRVTLTIAEHIENYERNHIAPKRGCDVARAVQAGVRIKEFFGAMTAADITDETIARYRAHRRAMLSTISDATLRRELQHLIAAMNYEERQKRLDPRDRPHIPLPPPVEPRSRVLTDAEVQTILSTRVLETVRGRAPRLSRVHRFVQLMLRAPARPEAVLGLTWFRVDLERRLIDYRVPGDVRSKKRRTPVPISSELLPVLQRAYAEKVSEYVLDFHGSIKTAFHTLVRECGFPDVTPYVLRHTYGTTAIARGVPPALVAEVMGDTLETVMRNYKHLIPGHLVAAVEGMWGAPAPGATTGVTPGSETDCA